MVACCEFKFEVDVEPRVQRCCVLLCDSWFLFLAKQDMFTTLASSLVEIKDNYERGRGLTPRPVIIDPYVLVSTRVHAHMHTHTHAH